MRLPSIEVLTRATRRVATRFPEAMLAAAIAAVFGHFATKTGTSSNPAWAGAWAAAALGISVFFTLAVTLERSPASPLARGAPRAVLALLVAAPLVAFALLWSHWSQDHQIRRLLQIAIALHLMASFVPFLGRREPNAFWQYNRTLFTRFLTGGLFSAVLFGGLGIALAAGKPLFGIKVPGQVYADLWLLIAFLFNTAFFLGGVPDDLAALESDERYPTVLKVFAQLILVPLVAIYLLILTAYLARILVTGQWPNGWIGYLVSSVSAAGILALLLVHPIRLRAENQWIATFARWFYLALLPSIGMLFVAIGKRIGQYGYTEDRYFLLVLSVWLAGIAVAYGLRRIADIRAIPITLCLLALVTLVGPWSAYAVPRADQLRRLLQTLRTNGLIDGDRAVRASGPVPVEARRSLSSMLRYLSGTHGLAALPAGLDSLALGVDPAAAGGAKAIERNGAIAAQRIMTGLGLQYIESWQASETRSFSFYSAPASGGGDVEQISGFDYALLLRGSPPFDITLDRGRVRVVCDPVAQTLKVEVPWGAPRVIPLGPAIQKVMESGAVPYGIEGRPPLRIEPLGGGRDTRFVAYSLNGSYEGDTISSIHLDAHLFLVRTGAVPDTVARR